MTTQKLVRLNRGHFVHACVHVRGLACVRTSFDVTDVGAGVSSSDLLFDELKSFLTQRHLTAVCLLRRFCKILADSRVNHLKFVTSRFQRRE